MRNEREYREKQRAIMARLLPNYPKDMPEKQLRQAVIALIELASDYEDYEAIKGVTGAFAEELELLAEEHISKHPAELFYRLPNGKWDLRTFDPRVKRFN